MNIAALLLGARFDNILRFICTLFIFVAVLALTYFVTRWIAKYQQSIAPKSKISVLDTYKIAPNKYIQVVKVGETYLVIAVSKDNVTMLTQLEESQLGDISLYTEAREEKFSDILDRVKSLHRKK